MRLSSDCMFCLINRQNENLKKYNDENLKAEYMKDVLSTVSSADENSSAPLILSKINKLYKKYFNENFSFDLLKKEYNKLMLAKEQEISLKILTSNDRLLESLKFARVGNYIDFGALGSVDNNKLDSLLTSALDEKIDSNTYDHFKMDLKNAASLVYLTDNCGEIVLDKLFIKAIKESYPHLKIKVIVRGIPILNDATLEDAMMVGLTDVCPVYGNGTDIAGTDLNEVSPETKKIINDADLIISKGQGNFESLHGCGLNIYYIFLCKCDYFVKRFNLEKFTGVFINEKDL